MLAELSVLVVVVVVVVVVLLLLLVCNGFSLPTMAGARGAADVPSERALRLAIRRLQPAQVRLLLASPALLLLLLFHRHHHHFLLLLFFHAYYLTPYLLPNMAGTPRRATTSRRTICSSGPRLR